MKVSFVKSAIDESHYPAPDRLEVAFMGRSNVGKSSLINALANRKKLARTGSTPGRTQMINFFAVGSRLYLVDLPGYGFARVPVKVKDSWGRMVEKYLINRPTLKAAVVILDIRRDPAEGDKDLLGRLKRYGIHSIIVLTKADKLSRQKSRRRAGLIGKELEGISHERPLVFSARTGEGRDEIWEKIQESLGIP